MCTGNIINFWCPCRNWEHRREGPLNPDTMGHKVVWSVNQGAYWWCHAYFKSPSFRLGHSIPPECPNCPTENDFQYEYMHFRSSSLCDDCVRRGCRVERQKRGMYGRRAQDEMIQALMLDRKKGGTAYLKAAKRTRERMAQKAAENKAVERTEGRNRRDQWGFVDSKLDLNTLGTREGSDEDPHAKFAEIKRQKEEWARESRLRQQMGASVGSGTAFDVDIPSEGSRTPMPNLQRTPSNASASSSTSTASTVRPVRRKKREVVSDTVKKAFSWGNVK